MGRRQHPDVALDHSLTEKQVPELIRRVLAEPGELRIAAAYVTGDVPRLLGLPRRRLHDVTLLCDPWSGNCNPRVLSDLSDAGVVVRCRAGLHAKVYIAPSAAVVGSANLSFGALGADSEAQTLEAAATVRSEADVEAAARWFDALCERARTWRSIRESPVLLGRIEAAYAAKRRRGRPEAAAAASTPRLTLLEALRRPDFLAGANVRIGLAEESDDMPNEDAAALAEEHEVNLEGYEVLEDLTPMEIKRMQRELHSRGRRPWVLTLWTVYDGRAQVEEFSAIDPAVVEYEPPLPSGTRLFMFSQPVYPGALPFDLRRPSRQEALHALNRGLRRHPDVAARLSEWTLHEPALLAHLLT